MAKIFDMSDWSHKAMMHPGDADLFEALVEARALSAAPRLDVLEWGSGRSTLYFARRLRELGRPFHWLSLEYDPAFFERDIDPALQALGGASAEWVDENRRVQYDRPDAARATPDLEIVLFSKGVLSPFLETHIADRSANMDDYVSYPSQLGRRFDLILVDGRMRRRCLLEAARLMKPGGATLLHDAHRDYYHCAFNQFVVHRFIGEILWIGSQSADGLAGLP